jgi:hypothetical protein
MEAQFMEEIEGGGLYAGPRWKLECVLSQSVRSRPATKLEGSNGLK